MYLPASSSLAFSFTIRMVLTMVPPVPKPRSTWYR